MNEHEPPGSRQSHLDDNLAVVKRLYDAFGRRDIEAVLGELTEDVEWSEPENPFNPAGGTRVSSLTGSPFSRFALTAWK